VLSDPRLNHRAMIREGVLADEARALLQEFFRKKRARGADT
jgi:tRNA(Arg) A34 adenosine deaminase TadA